MFKTRNMFKFLILLLATALVMPVLATVAQDVPTLDYYYVLLSAKPDDLQAVEDAVNDILVEQIGAKVKLHPQSFTDYQTKANLILNSGDACDVMSFGGFNPFPIAVASGGLMDIGDLVQEHAPNAISSVPADYWNAVKNQGKTYVGLTQHLFGQGV